MSPSRTPNQKRLKLVGENPRSLGGPKIPKRGGTLISRDMLTLSKPTKRCILAQLSKKPRTIVELANACKRTQSTINKALKTLTEQQLVQSAEPLGRKKQYELASRIKVTVRGQYADFDVHTLPAKGAKSGGAGGVGGAGKSTAGQGRLQVSCRVR